MNGGKGGMDGTSDALIAFTKGGGASGAGQSVPNEKPPAFSHAQGANSTATLSN